MRRGPSARSLVAMDAHYHQYCSLPSQRPPSFADGLDPDRLSALFATHFTWVNGTVLHYYFFDRETDGSVIDIPETGERAWVSWVGGKEQQDVVRECFQTWKALGIGLEFAEVRDRTEAELRIGFQRGDGSYSKLGRTALDVPADLRTMNFGWDLTAPGKKSTALHEIGHALGMPHEHQSPFAGIVWDEERVYEALAGPPNFWDRAKTLHNIIAKYRPEDVDGTPWDSDSIMHYPIPEGWILKPEEFHQGIRPPGTLSAQDSAYARRKYPRLAPPEPPALVPLRSVPLVLLPGEQADFLLAPDATRDYSVGTFGDNDTVLVLFEEIDGEPRYLAGVDDGGLPDNGVLTVHLVKGRRYHVRVRMRAVWGSGQAALMCW
jgi:hypothetical protein